MASASSSRTRSSSGPVLRSISPSGRFCSFSSSASSSAFASSPSSSFSSHASSFFHRSSSPTRVNICGPVSSPSVRFSLERSISPGRSLSFRDHHVVKKPISGPPSQKRTCMCSPTNHPGSFRCSLHKNSFGSHHSVSAPSNRLLARRSAMTNSLVRIGTVEGDLVKRALAALIRPSSHQQRRRSAFQPRPSRLSIMSKAVDCLKCGFSRHVFRWVDIRIGFSSSSFIRIIRLLHVFVSPVVVSCVSWRFGVEFLGVFSCEGRTMIDIGG